MNKNEDLPSPPRNNAECTECRIFSKGKFFHVSSILVYSIAKMFQFILHNDFVMIFSFSVLYSI